MMTGTIKTLTDKGFGFIVTFDELKVGDTVSFEVIQSEKGPAATKVSRV